MVEGVVFELSCSGRLLKWIPTRALARYRRVIVDVESEGESLSAWTYIAQPAFVREGLRQPEATWRGYRGASVPQ